MFSPSPSPSTAPFDASRRRFLRGASFAPDAQAWDDVYARAERFGIVPGTLVDAHGRPAAPDTVGTDAFIGQIAFVAFDFAPRNFALCNGQLLPINQNAALFSLLGTTFGGNGQTTFALPDLRGRLPVHFGQGPGLSNVALGQTWGVEAVTLLTTQLPAHTHATLAATSSTSATPVGAAYGPAAGTAFGAATAVGPPTGVAGGSQPHPNLPPMLALTPIICLYGVFPSRN